MPTEFDQIKDLPGWRAKLDQLLAAAREVMREDNLDLRLAVAERLTNFIVSDPPALPDDPPTMEYAEMDRLAKDAHDALLLDTIRERVAAIERTTAALAAERKKIENRNQAPGITAKTKAPRKRRTRTKG